MKASIYIKNYLINDIILVLLISGIFYFVTEIMHNEQNEEEMTVEVVPIHDDIEENLS